MQEGTMTSSKLPISAALTLRNALHQLHVEGKGPGNLFREVHDAVRNKQSITVDGIFIAIPEKTVSDIKDKHLDIAKVFCLC